MSSHFIVPSSSVVKTSDERLYDLSLRALMVIVITALIVSVAYLAWRWMIASAPNPSPVVPVTAVPRSDTAALNDINAQPSDEAKILLKPGQMYRCVRSGVVTFSDHPCAEGTEHIMRLPEAQ